LPAQIEAACFRLVQEAMNNIVRHARAKEVSVTVIEGPDSVDVSVHDDGVGFDPRQMDAGARTGIGLLGLHERAAMVGGEVWVDSVKGSGTTVFSSFPIREDKGA
jgi:signal transduction histidine kinase